MKIAKPDSGNSKCTALFRYCVFKFHEVLQEMC